MLARFGMNGMRPCHVDEVQDVERYLPQLIRKHERNENENHDGMPDGQHTLGGERRGISG